MSRNETMFRWAFVVGLGIVVGVAGYLLTMPRVETIFSPSATGEKS